MGYLNYHDGTLTRRTETAQVEKKRIMNSSSSSSSTSSQHPQPSIPPSCCRRCRVAGKSLSSSMTIMMVMFVMTACLAAVTPVAFAQRLLDARNILVSNPGIQVPLGRSVYLTREDLKIRVAPGDRCVVMVLDNDPLAQRPGRLMPTSFPCEFGPREVAYSHFGSRHPPNDRIQLQIRYDSFSDTLLIPFTLFVEVSFVQLQVITRNVPIEVERLMGVSTPISDKTLEYDFDRETQMCKITVLSSSSGLPRYGVVMNDTSRLEMVDCDEFLTLGVRYRHTADTASPNKDYIPMVVELFNQEGRLVKQEYFQTLVRIKEGNENEKPAPAFDARLSMEVDQFVMTALTPEILAAQDAETDPDLIIFNVSKPLLPGEGHFVSTDDRSQPITSFYQRDLRQLKIAYKPPSDDSDQRRIVVVEFQAVDSDGDASEPFILMIMVKPMNTLAPVVTTNTGLQLFEGQTRALQADRNLRISDEDNLEDVTVSAVAGLRHGRLIIPDGRKFFTPDDLESGSVIYEHDGSDTYSDNIVFRMTDGKHEVEFLFPVWVFPEDDEPPILNVNTGLEIQKKQVVEITPFVLSATDIDSDDSTIRFVLQPPFSDEGQILLRQFQAPDDPETWTLENGVYEKVVKEFTQNDIMDGKVFYRHVGPHRNDFVLDHIYFHLEDGATPPNESDLKEFIVKVAPVDDQLPYLYPGTTLEMDVDEFELTEFRRKVLRYTDDDTDDRDIKFHITVPPFDTDVNTPMEAGDIVLCEDDVLPINFFTQAQVNHRKVCYKPPGSELGVVPRILQFFFDVEDASSNVLPNQRFTVMLQPVDNHPPIITNAGIRVDEDSSVVLTPDILNVEDPDSDEDDLQFEVVETPLHGVFNFDEVPMEVGDVFTRKDLYDGRMSYGNVGENGGKDNIGLDVTDGVHHVPIKINVDIKSVDDESPTLAGVDGGILAIVIEVDENSDVTLSPEDLKASDPDTDDLLLTFMLEEEPYEGLVMREDQQTTRFTQADLREGMISYLHTGGEVGPEGRSDSFVLTLTDGRESASPNGAPFEKIVVEVVINPVDSEPPIVTLGQPFEVLESDKAPILPRHLDATDIDTEDTDIMCMIVQQPRNGYLENVAPAPGSEKPRVGIPVSSFTIRDIRLGVINYVQSVHKGVEPREDQFSFQCSDGLNFSPKFDFPIDIFPTNDEEPEVALREFMVVEGGNLMIDLPILNVVDADEPTNTVTFVITQPPQHGQIVRQTREGSFPVTNFTLDDISGASTIEYEHDDTETISDSFGFNLLDGVHNVSMTVPIKVFPVDDETPRLTINNGLEMETAGETKVITNDLLKAEDLDSNDASLVYIIRQKPKFGYLHKVDPDSESTNLTQGMNFTQRDIDVRTIHYTHTGIGGVRDLIKLDVTDGLNPLIDRYFYVTVEGLDMVYPTVINKGVELPEAGTAILTTDLLSGADLNTPDENLQFIITRAPARGYLESSDRPGVPITAFSQLELAGNKIRYVHTSGDEMKMDSFEFEVTDGFNPVARTFRISLSDVDNRKPVVMFQKLHLKEGDQKLITPFELKAEDRDTPDESLTFTVTQAPIHGLLLYNTTRRVSVFTMEDLNDNLISYQHDQSETLEDSFSFTVTDGTHSDYFVYPDTTAPTRRPQTMDIEIIPVDNGIPQVSINSGASTLSELGGGTLGFQITPRVLSVEDRDSPDDSLLYALSSEPSHGYLINRALGNVSISNWTQGDINRNQIEYVLKYGADAASDSFEFKISDKGGNVLANQPFHLNWAWISLESDFILVNETEPHLEVLLRRRGYLGETSFVSITAVNDSARVGEDVSARYAGQVQFNPGQTEKAWRIRLIDDAKYEEAEILRLKLSQPIMAVLEFPSEAIVTILDAEDEPFVFFTDEKFRVAEDIGEVLIPVQRKGDLSDETMVICATVQGNATGTLPSTVTSFSDYITRPDNHRSALRFAKGEKEKFCRVTIIDDSLFEQEESFKVVLTQPMGGRVGEGQEAVITIEPDKNDEPTVYFGSGEYEVEEGAGFVEVAVWRTGTDLSITSSVTVRSKRSSPKSAESGLDYVAVNKILSFVPGVTMQKVKVTILDDLGRPRVEGPETFQLLLRMPGGAMLGDPSVAVITINDSISDVPSMQFKETSVEVQEEGGVVRAVVQRSGDVSHQSQVRCYTRQDSATVDSDYLERPDTNASLIVFSPGDYEQVCEVSIVNDTRYEEEESFRLVLGTPVSLSLGAASVGKKNVTRITIKDDGDKPVIQLSDNKYTVREPMFKEETSVLSIPVLREGDLTETAVVTINTKDGSAEAGKDYAGFFKEVVFGANVSRQDVDIEILYDTIKEMREVFTVHLKHRSGTAEVKTTKAIVFIEERTEVADVTFPTQPAVVSLRDYDRAEDSSPNPVQGYPLVCITPCNPKHPQFKDTDPLCRSQGINDTMTLFRWRVAAPSGRDGVTSHMRDVESATFFASTKGITLDSIYFSGGSRVQCGARAVNTDGDPGLESLSEPITISRTDGVCEPRVMGSVGAEPFTAKLRYTGPDDPVQPNKVRISVRVPHRDGMLPVISTRQLSNFELTLSKDGTRLAIHRCSNLLDFGEISTGHGFLTNETKNPNIIGEVEPYQFNPQLRPNSTLRFYRNLDLDSCLWEFVSYYDMSELITDCGGEINTDGQVLDLKQSYVAMRIPLYVSYVFHSPVARGGWLHYDLVSQLQLTFVYDTSVLWQKGISSPESENGLQGYLYPTSMRMREDGRLSVSFRTEARFRGQFVDSHPGTDLEAMVMSEDHPDLTFTLELVRSDPSYEQSNQEWVFVSDFSVRDYSGLYQVKLIPCTTAPDQEYTLPIVCTPREPVTFDLPVRFQQVSDAVPARFSLNTDFHLLRKRELWLSDGSMGFGEEGDAAFAEGDRLYGRINVDPVQSLGSSFQLNIEKVFLCSGTDGYIPKYDPDNQEYGCIAETPNLQYTFKILDKGAPFTEVQNFQDIPFQAVLASDDPSALPLVQQSGSDGFSMDCTPLFQVDAGRQWFLHAIYTIRSAANAGRGIGKRSVEETLHHSLLHAGSRENGRGASRVKREEEDVEGVGEGGKGTNIARVQLDLAVMDEGDVSIGTNVDGTPVVPIIPIIIISVLLLILIGVILLVLFLLHLRRKRQTPPPSPAQTITVVAKNGQSRVHSAHAYSNDNTEV
ncbi:LOW QUALITY PROTEIN: extracellular matrix protein 3-like [Babylonia areolata]|uniref:LOW QUALITY PROTEIN: extracellular matrix protein 3-like n=1 Tax=Babylonia areolata TaxID=304850 RepID=UPI003FD58AE8